MIRAFLFDVETTGLVANRTMADAKLPEIIEFYGMIADLDSGEKLDEFETFVRPTRTDRIDPKVTRITGIRMEDLADAPTFPEISGKIRKLVDDAEIVIGHNVSFDKEMIEIEMNRAARHPISWPRRTLCTVEQTVHLKGFRLNLGALHEYIFGEPFAGAHRAKVDVEALLRCVLEMQRRDWI